MKIFDHNDLPYWRQIVSGILLVAEWLTAILFALLIFSLWLEGVFEGARLSGLLIIFLLFLPTTSFVFGLYYGRKKVLRQDVSVSLPFKTLFLAEALLLVFLMVNSWHVGQQKQAFKKTRPEIGQSIQAGVPLKYLTLSAEYEEVCPDQGVCVGAKIVPETVIKVKVTNYASLTLNLLIVLSPVPVYWYLRKDNDEAMPAKH